MIESIFQLKWVVSHHQQAPLLKEREQFLAHCQQQGTSHKALHNMAPELIAVIRFLRMEELREVSLEEIKLAAEAWAAEQRSNPRARSYAKSASYFIFVAKKWLRFHGKLKMPSPPRARFANELDDFVAYMASEQGLSPISIRSHRWKTSKFLEWFANRHRLLSSATLDDVDEFLAFKANNGWNRESVSTAAQALRSFFRHAERRGWCKAGIAAGIQGPKIYQYAGLPEGPTGTMSGGYFKAQKAQALLLSARGQSCFWSPFMDCEVVRYAGFSSTTSTGGQKRVKGNQRSPEGGWQGVSESAVRAKRGGVWFGAQPARSETPVRAAAEWCPPEGGHCGRKAVRTAEVCVGMIVCSSFRNVHDP